MDVLSAIDATVKGEKIQLPPFAYRFLENLRARKDGLMHYTFASLVSSSRKDGEEEEGRRAHDRKLSEILAEMEETRLEVD